MKSFIFFLSLFCTILPEKIVIKLPTRERPDRAKEQIERYYNLLSGTHHITFIVSIDEDDPSMNNAEIIEHLEKYPNLYLYVGNRTTKVGAINRDIEKHLDFDILLLASDDMTPIIQNYDQVIVDEFKKYFPDLDGTLHFNDGHVEHWLNTFPIMGKKYYERFNYIYHPNYQSIECDREYTIVSQLLNKTVYINQILFRHDHPLYGAEKDNLFKFNETPKKHRTDQQTFQLRKRNNFYLVDQTDYINSNIDCLLPKQKEDLNIRLSILIPTLDSRTEQFKKLYSKLLSQITKHNLEDKVEIVYFKDNKQHTVGYKRNKLIAKAVGAYTCFLDDDDNVHNDYVKLLIEATSTEPDCVGITGIMTDKGQNPIQFEQSLKNKTHSKKDSKYYWPIRHLNPIKRSITATFIFPEKNDGEDTDWCKKLNDSGLLKTEAFIGMPIYFYNYDLDKSETRIQLGNGL